MATQQKTVKVQLVRSPIGTKSDHRATVRGLGLRKQLAGHGDLSARRRLIRSTRVRRLGFVEIVDLQHQLDRRNAADRIRRERAQPQRHGADQLAIDVHRAAAHSARDIGPLRLAAHLADDHVLLGPPGVFP